MVAVIILVGIVAALWEYIANFGFKPSPDHGHLAAFGDYFAGLLNPIISFFAFLALLYTVRIQSDELKKSTEQLEASAKALEIQNKHWEKQAFENTFFQLFGFYRNVVESTFFEVYEAKGIFENKKENVEYKGKRAVGVIYSYFINILDKRTKEAAWVQSPEVAEMRYLYRKNTIIPDAFKEFYTNGQFKHFARDLLESAYNVASFVAFSNCDDEQKKYYLRLFFSYLSMDEQGLIFYALELRGESNIDDQHVLFKHNNPERG